VQDYESEEEAKTQQKTYRAIDNKSISMIHWLGDQVKIGIG
jgi:hypothetical protein